MKIFFADGRVLAPGATLVQRDLADSLRAIAAAGPDALFRGELGRAIVRDVRARGGILSHTGNYFHI